MATELTLERIQEMKEKLFQAFNALGTPVELEPTSLQRDDPAKAELFRRAQGESLRRSLSSNADRLSGLSQSFASLVLAEVALTSGQPAALSQPTSRPVASGGREPRTLDR